MLSSSPDALLKLSKTTFPKKILVPSDCIPLFMDLFIIVCSWGVAKIPVLSCPLHLPPSLLSWSTFSLTLPSSSLPLPSSPPLFPSLTSSLPSSLFSLSSHLWKIFYRWHPADMPRTSSLKVIYISRIFFVKARGFSLCEMNAFHTWGTVHKIFFIFKLHRQDRIRITQESSI